MLLSCGVERVFNIGSSILPHHIMPFGMFLPLSWCLSGQRFLFSLNNGKPKHRIVSRLQIFQKRPKLSPLLPLRHGGLREPHVVEEACPAEGA